MKTSSKILTGFFIIVFLVPLALFMSFKSKIKNGQYTLVRNDSFESSNSRKGDLGTFKMIKLLGTKGNGLKVNLSVDSAARYKYSINDNDSLKIYHEGDTVFIQSMIKVTENQNEYYHNELWIDLSVPSLQNIIVNNAEAFINTNDSSAINAVDIVLNENSSLFVGTRNENYPGQGSEVPLKIEQLSVKANDARFFIGENVRVSQLKLETNGSSDVTISRGAQVSDVTGSLSDSSTVKAGWQYLKKLTGLTQP